MVRKHLGIPNLHLDWRTEVPLTQAIPKKQRVPYHGQFLEIHNAKGRPVQLPIWQKHSKSHNKSADNSLFINLDRIFAKKQMPQLTLAGVISRRKRRALSNLALSFGMVICPLRPRCARPKGEASFIPVQYAERCIKVRP